MCTTKYMKSQNLLHAFDKCVTYKLFLLLSRYQVEGFTDVGSGPATDLLEASTESMLKIVNYSYT